MKRFVTVTGKDERREAGLGDLNAKLLIELADQARLRAFPRINLTAWKLPQPFQMFTTWSFCDQHPSVGVNHGHGGDEENLDHALFLGRFRGCGKYSAGGRRHRCVG